MRLFVALLALVVCLLGAGAGASSVYAHANLDRAVPSADAKVAMPVNEVVLYFTQRLKPEGSWLKLTDAAGTSVSVSPVVDGEAKTIRTSLPALAPAVYTVQWQSLSLDDDDYADGSFRFTVLRPDGSDPGSPSSPSGEATPNDDDGSSVTMLVVALVAGLVLIGGAAFVMRRPRGVS